MILMSKKRNIKNFFIVIAGVLLVSYIFGLIFITYLDQKKLDAFQNKEIESHIKSKAATLEYFFASLKNDFTQLSKKETISMYFANKDLGMSMTYGLRASIIKIDKLLIDFVENKSINNVKIFKEITIFSNNNELLSSTNKDSHINIENLNLKPNSTPEILLNNNSKQLEPYIFISLYYKDRFEGTIIATLNLKEVLEQLKISNNEKLILSSDNKSITPSYLNIKINGTPYTLYELKILENEKTLSSEWFVLSLLFLAILVLFATYYLILLNNKNIKLKEERNSQKILLQQSKVAAVGEMLGNISHQWRQPLSIISVQATGLKLQLELTNDIDKENIIKCMEDINNQTQYLSKTIDDFRNFFKGNINDIHEFDLKSMFIKLENLTKDALSNNYIKCQYDIIDYKLIGNENLLIQGLINIFNNAKDALVEKLNQNEERLLFIETKAFKDGLEIKIKDNAGGIEEKVIDKIFEPYFTTKHESIGTGIGLYMSNQIITKQFKGTITVINIEFVKNHKKYNGAEFKIILPKIIS